MKTEKVISLFWTKINHSWTVAVLATWNSELAPRKLKGKISGILLTLKCHLYFFLHGDAHIAEYFANSFKEWVTEGVDVDGVDTADALNLN